jgi:hypothetical protein
VPPNQVCIDPLSFFLRNKLFLYPSDGLPSLELDLQLVSIRILIEVKEDAALNCISSEIVGLVDLDKKLGHSILIKYDLYFLIKFA